MKQFIPKFIGFLFNIFTIVAPKTTRRFAFHFFGRVKKVAISQEGHYFFERGRTHWLTVSGIKTALHQWGGGPIKVLFVHGWMSNSQRWQSFVDSLDPEKFTAYALDAPAHGASSGNTLNLELFRKAYEETLRVTGKIDTVVCHSFGNLAVIYQFLLDPDVPVKSYIMMGSPSGIDTIMTYFEDVFGASQAMLKNLSIRIKEVFKVPFMSISVKEFIKSSNSPILVIHEEHDLITPIGPIKEAVAGGSSVETFYTSGLNHTLKDERVIERAKSFILEHSNNMHYVS